MHQKGIEEYRDMDRAINNLIGFPYDGCTSANKELNAVTR